MLLGGRARQLRFRLLLASAALAGCPPAGITDPADLATDDHLDVDGGLVVDLAVPRADLDYPRPCCGLDCGPLRFAPPIVHLFPRAWLSTIEGADLNGDVRPDLVGGAAGRDVHLLFNTGAGTFHRPPPLKLRFGYSGGITAADLDGDGRPELIVSGETFWNRGGGQFQGPTDLTYLGEVPRYMGSPGSPADLNEDGKVDLIASGGDWMFHVLLNQGSARFTIKSFQPFMAGSGPEGSSIGAEVAGDIDGDGHQDVIGIRNFMVFQYFVMFGDGKGGFDGPYPRSPLLMHNKFEHDFLAGVGDLDGDGRTDLIRGTPTGIAVLISSARRAETPIQTNYQLGPGLPFGGPVLSGIAVGDLDRDGRLDLVLTDSSTGCAVILINQGAGKLLVAQGVPVTVGPGWKSAESPVLRDFDGDGKLDLAVKHFVLDVQPPENSAVSVFLNRTP